MKTFTFGPNVYFEPSRPSGREDFYGSLRAQVENHDILDGGTEKDEETEIQTEEWERIMSRLDDIDLAKLEATDLATERLNRLHDAMAQNNEDAFVKEFMESEDDAQKYETPQPIQFANVAPVEAPAEIAKVIKQKNGIPNLLKKIVEWL